MIKEKSFLSLEQTIIDDKKIKSDYDEILEDSLGVRLRPAYKPLMDVNLDEMTAYLKSLNIPSESRKNAVDMHKQIVGAIEIGNNYLSVEQVILGDPKKFGVEIKKKKEVIDAIFNLYRTALPSIVKEHYQAFINESDHLAKIHIGRDFLFLEHELTNGDYPKRLFKGYKTTKVLSFMEKVDRQTESKRREERSNAVSKLREARKKLETLSSLPKDLSMSDLHILRNFSAYQPPIVNFFDINTKMKEVYSQLNEGAQERLVKEHERINKKYHLIQQKIAFPQKASELKPYIDNNVDFSGLKDRMKVLQDFRKINEDQYANDRIEAQRCMKIFHELDSVDENITELISELDTFGINSSRLNSLVMLYDDLDEQKVHPNLSQEYSEMREEVKSHYLSAIISYKRSVDDLFEFAKQGSANMYDVEKFYSKLSAIISVDEERARVQKEFLGHKEEKPYVRMPGKAEYSVELELSMLKKPFNTSLYRIAMLLRDNVSDWNLKLENAAKEIATKTPEDDYDRMYINNVRQIIENGLKTTYMANVNPLIIKKFFDSVDNFT